MQELRFVAVSEDGRYAVLAVPGRSARFMLPIDERLRAVALGQTSRLAQYEIEVESPLRPKEIQARIRAGETVEEIADAAGIAVERVRWFEGPVLAERAYMADQAQTASVRRHGDSTPGPRLGEIVTQRLKVSGADPDDARWDAKKRDDGHWQVQLTFTSAGRVHVAEWVFDPRRRHVLPADDNAARMSLPGAEPPQPAEPHPGEATVTRLAPRLGTGSGHAAAGPAAPGHGAAGHGQGGWARHERPGSGRPSVADPPAPSPAQAPAATAPSVPVTAEPRSAVPPAPAAERKPLRPAAPEEPQQLAQAPVSAAAEAPRDHSPVPAPAEAAAAQAGPAAPPASTEPAGDQAGRQGRKVARGRRSSVPSWDEIMFGNSRQRD
jgi:Protein of unknown function (DUF3071)